MNSIKYSKEQLTIIDDIKNGNNVIVNAVAGSGKTTVILGISNVANNILVITYNKNLQAETFKKIENNKIKNVSVFTYHGFFTTYYSDTNCYSDKDLWKILKNDNKIKEKKLYDVIVFDEAQDMNDVLFLCSLKIIKDIKNNYNNQFEPSILILGDYLQCINEFRGSDPIYMKKVNKLYKSVISKDFIKRSLSVSYRLPKNVIENLNYAMQDIANTDNYINESKNAIDGNIYEFFFQGYTSIQKSKEIIEGIRKYSDPYKDDEIFILCPISPYRKYAKPSPSDKIIRDIIRSFEMKNRSIYMTFGTGEISKDHTILENKTIISTIHQSKGLERKCCILFITPSLIGSDKMLLTAYVALSRVIETLILVWEIPTNTNKYQNIYGSEYWKNVDITKMVPKTDWYKCLKGNNFIYKQKEDINVTDMVPLSISFNSNKLKEYKSKFSKIKLKQSIKNNGLGIEEDISNLCGILAETFITNLIHVIFTEHGGFKNNVNNLINEVKIKELYKECATKSLELEHVQEINEHILFKKTNNKISTNLPQYRKRQLPNNEKFSWYTSVNVKDDVINCLNIFANELVNPKFQYCIFKRFVGEKNEDSGIDNENYCNIIGKIDMYDDVTGIVYEFKYVKEITEEHLIQLIWYLFLMDMNDLNIKSGKLINIATKEIFEISIEDVYKYFSDGIKWAINMKTINEMEKNNISNYIDKKSKLYFNGIAISEL